MFNIKKSSGFTLFEVIIAVALVAIMAVAIAPPVIKNLNEGKVSRAQSDATVIGNAILQFYKDTNRWPLQINKNPKPDLTRLAGNGSIGGGNNGIPVATAGVKGGKHWASWGKSSSLTDQLIRNTAGSVKPIYKVSLNPHVSPGWNGPYLDSVPLDPWGNPFVVNIRYTDRRIKNLNRHNVMIVSAGPNQAFDTTFDDATSSEVAGGDDVAYIIRGAVAQ